MIPTGSTYFALENEALKAEIKKLTLEAIQMKLLCTRAADALEPLNEIYPQQKRSDLIAELRKAAQ
jgi:hypothetical protein